MYWNLFGRSCCRPCCDSCRCECDCHKSRCCRESCSCSQCCEPCCGLFPPLGWIALCLASQSRGCCERGCDCKCGPSVSDYARHGCGRSSCCPF